MERLFATEKLGARVLYRFQAITVFVGICLVLYYRATHIPADGTTGRAAWLGMLAAEVWFGFYWVLMQSGRWYPIRRRTFKDRLADRFSLVIAHATPVPPITVSYVLKRSLIVSINVQFLLLLIMIRVYKIYD